MAAPDRTDRVAETILFETTTFGIRSYRAGRKKLEREFMEAGAGRGTARVKIGRSGKRVIKAMPEYEDIKMIAKKNKETAARSAVRGYKTSCKATALGFILNGCRKEADDVQAGFFIFCLNCIYGGDAGRGSTGEGA